MKTPKVDAKTIVVCGKVYIFFELLSDANKPNFDVCDPTTSSWSEFLEPVEYSSLIKFFTFTRLEVQGICLQNSNMYILKLFCFLCL